MISCVVAAGLVGYYYIAAILEDGDWYYNWNYWVSECQPGGGGSYVRDCPKSQVRALKEVDPICSLKMWDWYVEINTTQELSLNIKNWAPFQKGLRLIVRWISIVYSSTSNRVELAINRNPFWNGAQETNFRLTYNE